MRIRRRVAASAAVVLAVLAASAPAGAATKSPTPISSLRAFAFDVEVVATGSASALGSSLTLSSTGMFVAPANQDCTVTATLGKLTLDQQLVVIGKKTFVDSGSGLEPGKAGDFDFAEFCPSNKDFWSSFAVKPPKGVTPTKEVRNGIATLHYDAGSDANALSGFSALGDLPADVTVSDVNLWFAARGGYLVSGATPTEQHIERIVRVAHRRVAGAAAGAVHGRRHLQPVARQRQGTRSHRAEDEVVAPLRPGAVGTSTSCGHRRSGAATVRRRVGSASPARAAT